ncbi:MAG: hypothetical protein WDA06_04590 [Phenylobacterium sp.]
MKYAELVEQICGRGWANASDDERNGGYGVAMVIAYMNGAKPDLDSLSFHVGVPATQLAKAFARLNQNNMFDDSVKNDVELGANAVSPTASTISKWSLIDASRCAWSHVAGIASGYIDRP